jgi:hypothetical protein
MHFLLTLDRDLYYYILSVWGALALIAGLAIYFLGVLPISNRTETPWWNRLGLIDKRLAWVLMETPVLATVLYCYFAAARQSVNYSVVMVGVFVLHYAHRALIYPWRIKVQGKKMPVGSMLAAMLFYVVNGYLIGYYFGALRAYAASWLLDPRFIVGMLAFVAGLALGIVLAVVRDTMDDKLRTRAEFESMSRGRPTIGLIPAIREWEDRKTPLLIVAEQPKSPAASSRESPCRSQSMIGDR